MRFFFFFYLPLTKQLPGEEMDIMISVSSTPTLSLFSCFSLPLVNDFGLVSFGLFVCLFFFLTRAYLIFVRGLGQGNIRTLAAKQ